MQLSPLAATDSDALAGALLRRIDPLPPQLTELIVGRADGNPYDMEELVRRRIDDGAIAVGEPRWTVQAMRLDSARLPPRWSTCCRPGWTRCPLANAQRPARPASSVMSSGTMRCRRWTPKRGKPCRRCSARPSCAITTAATSKARPSARLTTTCCTR